MTFSPETKSLIVQPDLQVLLEVRSPVFREVREAISPFLELVKSPSLFFTYHLTNVSVWNGLSTGLTTDAMIAVLEKYARFPVPASVSQFIRDRGYVFGVFRLEVHDATADFLVVRCRDRRLIEDLQTHPKITKYVFKILKDGSFTFPGFLRGPFKADMMKLDFPVDDRVGFRDGDAQPIHPRENAPCLRPYQVEAMEAFLGPDKKDGAGVIVLPCGAGKTLVGVKIMTELQMKTLVVLPNHIAIRQWRREILRSTDIKGEQIGEYTGEFKEIKPITLVTYQILVYRRSKAGEFHHFSLFTRENWGLIVYDEIHLLPAPVFRCIAGIQAKRRLGLTATLVREDNRERDVFALVGPKKYDLPWKELEKDQYIAEAMCFEIKVPINWHYFSNYFEVSEKKKIRIAAENPSKINFVGKLLNLTKPAGVLIIGEYISQLEQVARRFDLPLLTGKTPQATRAEWYKHLDQGRVRALVVSKIANFAVDLPNVSVAIEISGMFGSRQEEAQRLGRVIRPKKDGSKAYFFALVSMDTEEEIFARKRKLFLMKQGYTYQEIYADKIKDWHSLLNDKVSHLS